MLVIKNIPSALHRNPNRKHHHTGPSHIPNPEYNRNVPQNRGTCVTGHGATDLPLLWGRKMLFTIYYRIWYSDVSLQLLLMSVMWFISQARRHQAWARDHRGLKMSLSPPPPRNTLVGELCTIFFKFWSFLQRKSVNNVCKLLQLLGDCPQIS